MADEKKDYYTKLFNPLLDMICKANLSGREFRIVLFIIRSTYGWNKKSFPMSKSFIADGTGIDRRHVSAILNNLIKKNIIIEYGLDKDSRCKVFGLNKHYSQWEADIAKFGVPENGDIDITKNGDICAPNLGPDITENGDIDIAENGAQKRKSKKKELKEKEKKCDVKNKFYLDENGNWQQRKEGE